METGHTRSVISFYQGFWKAVVSISHHCHISCPLSMGFFKKSENICERKISAGRLRAEVFYLLSAFWTPKHMPLSTDLETGRVGLSTDHLLRELKMSLWLSATLMALHALCWMRMRKPGSCSRIWCITNQQESSCFPVPDGSLTISSDLSTVCQICVSL